MYEPLVTDCPNIIFDLGGVIINIDPNLATERFKSLTAGAFEEKYAQLLQENLFNRLEMGEVSAATFRNRIREVLEVEVADKVIDEAWNAMLLDIPLPRLKVLDNLKSTKRTALLSNTNEIHMVRICQTLKRSAGVEDFSKYFEFEHYSYQIGLRKPNEKIFEHVIRHHGFDPSETLFIDDSPEHIEAARSVGLNAYHLRADKGETLLDLFGHLS